MVGKFERFVQNIWYQKNRLYWLLIPFSLIYGLIVVLRCKAYQYGLFKQYQAPVPVLVIGNLTVGGNGKTPLVIWLVETLQQENIKVGVISRGYGGKALDYPIEVHTESSPQDVGDEPVLIHRRTQVPLVVAPKRVDAVTLLLKNYPDIQLVISDDGLQHYALARDLEWVVIDNKRKFGNGWWMPAGPMRERISRLNKVDAVILNCASDNSIALTPEKYTIAIKENKAEETKEAHSAAEFSSQLKTRCSNKPIAQMKLKGEMAVNLQTGEKRRLSEFTQVIAIAGIGDPTRFFSQLRSQNLTIIAEYGFADHYAFTQQDLMNIEYTTADNRISIPLLMTEKDAVKCVTFAQKNWWYLPIEAEIDRCTSQQLVLQILQNLQKTY